MNEALGVSIIVVNYNNDHFLDAAINSAPSPKLIPVVKSSAWTIERHDDCDRGRIGCGHQSCHIDEFGSP